MLLFASCRLQRCCIRVNRLKHWDYVLFHWFFRHGSLKEIFEDLTKNIVYFAIISFYFKRLRICDNKLEVFCSYLFPLKESEMESIILLYFKRKLDSFNVLHEMINNALQFKNNTFWMSFLTQKSIFLFGKRGRK